MSTDDDVVTLDPAPAGFRKLGDCVIDTIAEHYERIEEIPALTDAMPAEVATVFDDPLPRA